MIEDDATLLRRYADDKSEEAFAALVQRHLPLVYSIALRQVAGDAHLAEDVAQQVFTALARKAAALADRPALSGWLYRSTHFAASDVVRHERRRRAREQEAHTMNEIFSAATPESVADWERVRPTLDAAIAELNERDRDAVSLRFFNGCSFADIGVRLRLTENAARMRVERALDKLHAALARRGVTSTTAALGLALAQQAGAVVPASLVASVTSTALAGAAAGGGAWLAIFTMSKIKFGIVAALLLAGLATVVVEANANRGLRAEIATLESAASRAPALRTENRQLEAKLQQAAAANPDADELVRLRARAAQLRARPDGVDEALMKPAAAWQNVGRTTPQAALETGLWAVTNGDAEFFLRGYVFPGEMKSGMATFFGSQSEVVRARYGTPERLLGELWRLTPPEGIPVAYQLLDTKLSFKSDTDTATLRAWARFPSGEEKGATINMKRDATGAWGIAAGNNSDAAWAKLAARIDQASGELRSGPK